MQWQYTLQEILQHNQLFMKTSSTKSFILGMLCLLLLVSTALRPIDSPTDPLLQMLQASHSLQWCSSAHLVPCCSCSCRILRHAFNWRNVCQTVIDSWVMGGYKVIRRRWIKVLLWVILHRNSSICWCVRWASIKWMHARHRYLRHGLEQWVQSSNSFNRLFSHLHLAI